MISFIKNKIRKSISSVVFFDDLADMPFYNWRKLHETGEYKYLLKSGDIKNAKNKEISSSWHKLNNEYLKKYGLDVKTKIMLRDRKRLALNLASYLETLDKNYEMEADILQIDIKKSNQFTGTAISYTELLADIEESRGIPIDEKTTSTDKFLTYHKRIKDRNKKKLNFKAS